MKLTFYIKGDHDVSYATVDTGEFQRSDSGPDLQRFLYGFIHFSFWHVRGVVLDSVEKDHNPPVSQTRLEPGPRLKCKSEPFQLKETCIDWSLNISVTLFLSQDAHQ